MSPSISRVLACFRVCCSLFRVSIYWFIYLFIMFIDFGFPFSLFLKLWISLPIFHSLFLLLHFSFFINLTHVCIYFHHVSLPSFFLLRRSIFTLSFTPFSFSYSFPSPTLSLLHESYTHLQLFPSCFLPSLFFIKTFHRDPFNAAHIGNELCIRQWPPLEKTSRREF